MFLDLGSSQTQAALIVGFFLPLVLAIPIQTKWPPLVKTLFSVGAYAAAGAVVALCGGQLTGAAFWQSALLILTLGVVGYQGVWKPAGIAPAIERETNFQPAPPEAEQPISVATPTPNGGLAPEIKSLLAVGERLLHEATNRIAAPAEPDPLPPDPQPPTRDASEPEADVLPEAGIAGREPAQSDAGESTAWVKIGPSHGGSRRTG
jgi:hypothetical protein